MIDNLTREIIKRILANVGASPSFIGNKGLADKSFNLLKQIPVDYSDGTVRHDVYAGKLEISSESLRGLLVDLTVGKDYEFLFVFQLSALPIHALRIVFDPDELDSDCFFKIQQENGSWKIPDTVIMCKVLIQFERFVSYGLLWKECKEVNDLFEVAVKIINKE